VLIVKLGVLVSGREVKGAVQERQASMGTECDYTHSLTRMASELVVRCLRI